MSTARVRWNALKRQERIRKHHKGVPLCPEKMGRNKEIPQEYTIMP